MLELYCCQIYHKYVIKIIKIDFVIFCLNITSCQIVYTSCLYKYNCKYVIILFLDYCNLCKYNLENSYNILKISNLAISIKSFIKFSFCIN